MAQPLLALALAGGAAVVSIGGAALIGRARGRRAGVPQIPSAAAVGSMPAVQAGSLLVGRPKPAIELVTAPPVLTEVFPYDWATTWKAGRWLLANAMTAPKYERNKSDAARILAAIDAAPWTGREKTGAAMAMMIGKWWDTQLSWSYLQDSDTNQKKYAAAALWWALYYLRPGAVTTSGLVYTTAGGLRGRPRLTPIVGLRARAVFVGDAIRRVRGSLKIDYDDDDDPYRLWGLEISRALDDIRARFFYGPNVSPASEAEGGLELGAYFARVAVERAAASVAAPATGPMVALLLARIAAAIVSAIPIVGTALGWAALTITTAVTIATVVSQLIVAAVAGNIGAGVLAAQVFGAGLRQLFDDTGLSKDLDLPALEQKIRFTVNQAKGIDKALSTLTSGF